MQIKNRMLAKVRSLMVACALAVVIGLGGTIGAGAASTAVESADPTEAAAIQAVILKQIDAFEQDDAHTVFAIAAPEIQQRFGWSAMFMQMVRQGYAAVYRPRYVEFGPLVPYDTTSENTGRYVQHVVIEGADGAVMMAVYAMQKDDGGNWRIAGCNLTPLQRESL